MNVKSYQRFFQLDRHKILSNLFAGGLCEQTQMLIHVLSDYIKGLAIMDDKLIQQKGHYRAFNKVSAFSIYITSFVGLI